MILKLNACEEVGRQFGAENVHTFTGAAGSVFFEDTYGLHKGQLPTGKCRLLLRVRYSVVPTIFMSRARSHGVPELVGMRGYNPYVKRRFAVPSIS